MHIMFTEEEKKWIDFNVFGLRIKKGCPDKVRKSIENKKFLLDSQFDEKKRKKSKKMY